MYAAIAPRRNFVVDVHVPEAGDVGGTVLLEQTPEFAHLCDGRPTQTGASGDASKIATAVHGTARIEFLGAKFVELRAVSAIIHAGNQHLDALAADGLQLLD